MSRIWQWLCGKLGGHDWQEWYSYGYDNKKCRCCKLHLVRRTQEDYEYCWNK